MTVHSVHFILTIIVRLERSLRSFACLTKGDTIAIPYNKKVQVHITWGDLTIVLSGVRALCAGGSTWEGCLNNRMWHEGEFL